MGNVLAYSYSAVLYSGAFLSFIGTRNKYGPGSQDCSNKFAHSRNFYGSSFSIIFPDVLETDDAIAIDDNRGWVRDVAAALLLKVLIHKPIVFDDVPSIAKYGKRPAVLFQPFCRF